MHHLERRRSESLTRQVEVLPGCQALRVCGIVCNGHLMAQNRLWAGKPPCCLLTTIASDGLSPGRVFHLGSDHAALRRRACHLCSSFMVRAGTEGQITHSCCEVFMCKVSICCADCCRRYLSTDSQLPDAMPPLSGSLKSIAINEVAPWLQSRGLPAQMDVT